MVCRDLRVGWRHQYDCAPVFVHSNHAAAVRENSMKTDVGDLAVMFAKML